MKQSNTLESWQSWSFLTKKTDKQSHKEALEAQKQLQAKQEMIEKLNADGYDRSVMAVPGRATDGMSSGTNHLIRNRKAQLVMTADDIVRELMWDLGPEPAAFREKPSTPELTPDEAGLLGCFRTDDPLAVETLAELSGLEPGELAALLVGLELAGAVRQLPGNRYMKTR